MTVENKSQKLKTFEHRAQSVVRHVRLRMWVAIPALVILVVLTPFVAIFFLNTDGIQARATDNTILCALFVSLAVGSLIGIGLSVNILSPLKALESLGKVAASGKLIEPDSIKSIEAIANNGNEIGVIGLSFAESLMQINHEVRTHNRQLMDKLAVGIAVIDGNRNIQAINRTANIMLGAGEETSQSGILKRKNGNAKLTMNSELSKLIDTAEASNLDEMTEVITMLYHDPKEIGQSSTGLAPEIENAQRIHIKITALHDENTTDKSWMISMTDLRRQDYLLQQILTEETSSTLNTFVRGLAHELKTPLTTIRLRAQMLSEDIEQLPETNTNAKNYLMDHAESIENETQRLESLVKDIRDFVYLSANNTNKNELPQVFDIVNLAKTVTNECANLTAFKAQSEGLTHNPTIEFKSTGVDTLQCHGSDDRIRQAIQNLLSNAIRHTQDDGKIMVTVRHENSGSYPIRVCVENTGTPIDEQTQRRLFEPFFTTGAGGTGLGLPIAQQITLAHQGVLVHENLTNGVRFTIQLPEEWTNVNNTQYPS